MKLVGNLLFTSKCKCSRHQNTSPKKVRVTERHEDKYGKNVSIELGELS